MGHRLFVAVLLPPRTAEQLAAYAAAAAHDARRPPADNLHVTVHFLGQVDAPADELAGALAAACATLPRFDLRVAAGAWAPRRRPRMLWAALKPHPGFVRTAEQVACALAGLAPAARPPRTGRPHVTLARLREDAPRHAPPPLGLDDPVIAVDAITLMESRLSPRGSTYAALSSAPLLGRT